MGEGERVFCPKLTLYLIENPDHPSQVETIESFGNLISGVYRQENRNFDLIESPTEYYILMHTSEKIEEGLRLAIPSFLPYGFDYLIFYKKQFVNNEMKLFFAPRLFKKTVTLAADSIYPKVMTNHLKWEKVLDGWIRDVCQK